MFQIACFLRGDLVCDISRATAWSLLPRLPAAIVPIAGQDIILNVTLQTLMENVPVLHFLEAPSQALLWEVDAIDKASTLAIIGVYPPNVQYFPIGLAMNKNLTIKMGNCSGTTSVPPCRSFSDRLDIDATMLLRSVIRLKEIKNSSSFLRL